MWWLVPLTLPIIYYAGKKIFSEDENTVINNYSILEKNFQNIETLWRSRNNKICILGSPGAGKSSLIHSITNSKAVPLPKIGVETDTTDFSKNIIYDPFIKYENYYILDAPGYDTTSHPVSAYLDYLPFSSFNKIIYIFKTKFRTSDHLLIRHLIRNVPAEKIIFIRSFSDSLEIAEKEIVEKDLNNILNAINYSFKLNFISNRTKDGINSVRQQIFSNTKRETS